MDEQVFVWCTFSFEAWHKWDGEKVANNSSFLRNVHRHIFKVELRWQVVDLDREVEFIIRKREAEQLAKKKHQTDYETTVNWSCEHWASFLMKQLGACYASVSEDGENGAIIARKDHRSHLS